MQQKQMVDACVDVITAQIAIIPFIIPRSFALNQKEIQGRYLKFSCNSLPTVAENNFILFLPRRCFCQSMQLCVATSNCSKTVHTEIGTEILNSRNTVGHKVELYLIFTPPW